MADDGRTAETRDVVTRYFATVTARDVDAQAAMWKPGALGRIVGLADLVAPGDVRAYFTTLYAAFPDWDFQVTDMIVQGDRAAVSWTATATFAGPGHFQGLRPTGAKVSLEGVDIAEVQDGQIVGNTAYVDGATIARQLGAMPPDGSFPERALKALLNAKVAVAERLKR